MNWPTLFSCILVAGLFYGISCLALLGWMWHSIIYGVLIGLPALCYGLFGEQTIATSFQGKVVLVTGTTSGLGKRFALEVAKRGAKKIILVARNVDKNNETAAECDKAKTNKDMRCFVQKCDLTDMEDTKRMAAEVLKEHRYIDILINNAGAGEWKHIEETTPEDAIRMMACPAQCAIALSTLFVHCMIARKSGHIVNITSGAGNVGFRGGVGYGTARWAVRGFTKYLYWDLKELGIGVTCVNASEFGGSDYFKTAPGKAGGDSLANLPWLIQFTDRIGLRSTAELTCYGGLNAVERGYHAVNIPFSVMHVLILFNGLMPYFVERLCNVGRPGLRSVHAQTLAAPTLKPGAESELPLVEAPPATASSSA